MIKHTLFFVFMFSLAFANAQSDKTLVRQGNKSYKGDDFANAEIDYRKALDKNPNSLSGTFNLADAIYQQEDFEKSAELFAKIGQADVGKQQKGMAYYNLGNSFLKAQQYEQGIEAYKMALRNNPADEQARYNLEYARMMLKKQQEQQKQDQQNKDQDKKQDKKDQEDKKQDQENKDENQDKKDQEDQQKDQQDKKDQNQDQNQENKQDNTNDQGKPEQQMNDQQSKQISKKDAERMLEALKNNEKKTLEKLKKGKTQNVKVIKKEKDW